MRAMLIYNARSGTAASEDDLVAELAEVGVKVERSLSPTRMEECLRLDADVLVVAGGDGTVAKAAKLLAGTSVPMAILPMGTANNVARSLGIGVDAHVAVRGLAHALERKVDLGIVHGRGAEEYFVEGFGLGVFACFVAERATKKDKALRKALGLLADEVDAYAPPHLRIEVDGRDVSGRYLLAAVMNARSLGPALGVAPEAKCDDGVLDVVLVRPDAKLALTTHLRRAAEKGEVVLPAFETMRAKNVHVRANGHWAHIDDVPRQLQGDVRIGVAPGALRVLAPSPSHPRRS